MTVKKGRELEVSVADIAFGGKGLVKIDGLAVFVDQAVPGDRAVIKIVKRKKSFAEARVVELLQPSPFRVEPRCRYSGFCGGCKWQFLDYNRQLEFKRQHVCESLEHLALLKGVAVNPTLPSEKIFGYRNKMEFSCTDRRWLLPEELGNPEIKMDFALGLHVPGTFNKVFNVETCHLHPEEGNAIRNTVRAYMKNSGIPAYGLRSHQGFWRFLMLRHSVDRDTWMVNVVTAAKDRQVLEPLAGMLMETFPSVSSVVNNVTARKAGVATGEYEVHLAGDRTLLDRIGEHEFEISANSFFQTNTRGAQTLYETAREYAGLTGTENVLDLYCGTGTIAICLSDQARSIVGMEIVESAIADARKNCERNSIDNCRFILGDIRQLLADYAERPDVMIIDPPRSGMHKDVASSVLEIGAPRIVYVSCNPATLARDIALLKHAYRVVAVQPVDMFPHTFHIEAVARLDKIKE
jgi:23S rRNA (uracil1939-C5)-methyltransferase